MDTGCGSCQHGGWQEKVTILPMAQRRNHPHWFTLWDQIWVRGLIGLARLRIDRALAIEDVRETSMGFYLPTAQCKPLLSSRVPTKLVASKARV